MYLTILLSCNRILSNERTDANNTHTEEYIDSSVVVSQHGCEYSANNTFPLVLVCG